MADRQAIMERMAEHFELGMRDYGDFDLNDYEWQSGCYINHTWFCPANVVELIEAIVDDVDAYI